jgi:hypothetical protein
MVISIANSGVGTTIYRVDQVRQPVDADPKIRQAQAQQIQALTAQSEFSGLMGFWRNKAEVKMINPLKAPNSNASGS